MICLFWKFPYNTTICECWGDKTSCNDTIYQKLGGQFTTEEAYGATINVRGFEVQKGRVLTMLYRWEKQGIVQRIEKGVYKKTYRLTV